MKITDENQKITDENEMSDDYGHLPFKPAKNRFAKYRNAKVYVIDEDGTRHELSEYEQKTAKAGED